MPLVALCAVLHLGTRVALPPTTDASFNAFQRTYLMVYLLAMGKNLLCTGK